MLFENIGAAIWPAFPTKGLLQRIPQEEACRIVTGLTAEMLVLAGGRSFIRRDRRRVCHIRQISMYVCHVVLRLPQVEIAQAFGRDRSTVGHACSVIEDRRDDPDFDAFVTAIERLVQAVFPETGAQAHG